MAKAWGRYRWLNYQALLARFVLEDQQLEAVKYFTTRATDPVRRARQDRYLDALRIMGVEIIEGSFEMRPKRCEACGEWFKRPQEKETDVNIATHLLVDAFDGRATTIAIVSADSDLVPAVRTVRERFGVKVLLIDPPRRHSDDLAALASAHLHFSRADLSAAQLPNPVEIVTPRNKIKRIHRPDEWGA